MSLGFYSSSRSACSSTPTISSRMSSRRSHGGRCDCRESLSSSADSARPSVIVARSLSLSRWGSAKWVSSRSSSLGLDCRRESISRDLYSLVLTTTVVTMVLTPFLYKAAPHVHGLWQRVRPEQPSLITYNLPEEEMRDHVVVVGFGRTGRAAVDVMERVGLPYVILELDYRTIEMCEREGHAVIYGDATSEIVLHAAGVERARLLLATIPDVTGVELLITRARDLHGALRIVARAMHEEQLKHLGSMGYHGGGPTRVRSRSRDGAAGAHPVPGDAC